MNPKRGCILIEIVGTFLYGDLIRIRVWHLLSVPTVSLPVMKCSQIHGKQTLFVFCTFQFRKLKVAARNKIFLILDIFGIKIALFSQHAFCIKASSRIITSEYYLPVHLLPIKEVNLLPCSFDFRMNAQEINQGLWKIKSLILLLNSNFPVVGST